MENPDAQNNLRTKTLRNLTIPSIGFGTYKLTGDECREGVGDALEMGYRHIDTAQMYKNEIEVGMGMKESGVKREDIFLTDKIWFENLEPETLKHSFVKSLEKLQTKYVDLLLIHWPSPEGIPLKETLSAMHDFKQQKTARWIGVSNFTPELLEQALEHEKVACNQVEYHPFLAQDKLLKMAALNELFITAYSPVAQGEVMENEDLMKIGEMYGKNPAQVSLRWLIQQDNVIAIPKSASHEHRQSNLEIFDFELTDQEMDKISSLARGKRLVNPEFAPEWK